jgi:hypothetical protein
MKASFLIPALALGILPATVPAAELAQSPNSSAQDTASRAQADALRSQTAAAKAQAEAAARASQDIARAAQAEAARSAVTAAERAKVDLERARMAEARAAREADLVRIVAAKRIPGEPVTFLGVMTAPAPTSLTTQLGRPAGMGLVVVSVQAKSPADEILQVDDLLVKLDDQKLINNEQLTALIRSHQEGEEVTVTYVRGGKEATAKVKLVKQEAAPVALAMTKIAGAPGGEAKYLVQENDDMKIGSVISGNTTLENGRLNQTFTYTIPGVGPLELRIVDGKRTVTASNPDGSVLFSGPYDTDEERKAAPASVQTRMADLEGRISRLQSRMPAKVAIPAPVAPPSAPKGPVPAPSPVR